MTPHAQPIGAVLAGGRGRRIGGDKAIVELDGRPLVTYALDALHDVVDDVAVVAKRDTALPPAIGDVNVWVEPDEPQHPLCGVVHALRLAAGRPVLAVAGDMPLLDPWTLRVLCTADPGAAAAVVARAGGRLEPLCALYTPLALAGLASFDPGGRATDALEALEIVTLDFDSALPFFSVNAPEDLLEASALLAERRRAESG